MATNKNQSSSTASSTPKPHCLVIPYPTQGHINPMLQFSKRIIPRGVRVTLVNTRFISKTVANSSSSASACSTTIHLATISDGFDDSGFAAASMDAYCSTFQRVGSRTLSQLVAELSETEYPATCIIYDHLIPWCLDVAKSFGLITAAFFTQSCAVESIYYHVREGLLQLPVVEAQISIPGLPPLEPKDMPSFIYAYGSYPAALEMLLGQFDNIDEADWVLCNTIYELEQEAANWLSKLWPIKTVGPTIPSMYLNKQLSGNKDYGLSIFKSNCKQCMDWLDNKRKGSVIYVSFGSMASLGPEQMEELSHALKNSNRFFLWVVRASEEAKLPLNFDPSEKGLIVSWCPQLEVLDHHAVGCFVTHCGWNSTLEALSLGVPMVAMPQWTDQGTNAKYIEDVWKIGVRAESGEDGIVKRGVVEKCLREVMEGKKGEEMKSNAKKWKRVMEEAVSEGGSSNKNINEFVDSLIHKEL